MNTYIHQATYYHNNSTQCAIGLIFKCDYLKFSPLDLWKNTKSRVDVWCFKFVFSVVDVVNTPNLTSWCWALLPHPSSWVSCQHHNVTTA